MHERLRQQSAENTKLLTFDHKMFTPTGTGRFPHVRVFPDNFTVEHNADFFDDSIERNQTNTRSVDQEIQTDAQGESTKQRDQIKNARPKLMQRLENIK